MSHSISGSDLQTLLREAEVAARRLMRRLRLPSGELADLRQDLLVDAVARLAAFNPDRGTLGAFAGVILTNRAARIAARWSRHRRLYGLVPVSLDDDLPEAGGATRGDLIAQEDGLAARLGQPVDDFAEVERRLSVASGLGRLDRNDAAFCAELSRTTVDRLAAGGHGARSSLYRRLKDIRLALTAFGLEAA